MQKKIKDAAQNEKQNSEDYGFSGYLCSHIFGGCAKTRILRID
jgi:hypothetical protein